MIWYVCVSPRAIAEDGNGIVVVNSRGDVSWHRGVRIKEGRVVQDRSGLRRRFKIALGVTLPVDPTAWVETESPPVE